MQEAMFFTHVSAWNETHAMENGRDFELHHNSGFRCLTPEFHCHDYYEIYFYIAGEASLHIEEYAFRMNPRDVYIIPPGRMHRACFHDPKAYYERMFLYISCAALQQMSTPDCPLLAILDGCAERGHFRHALSEEQYVSCMRIFDQIIADSANSAPHQQLINRCNVTILLARLCGHLNVEPSEEKLPASTRVTAVIAHINKHLSERLTLDEISSRFYVSKFYLIREFKNYTNKSIYQYILSKRVFRAKMLMQSGVNPTNAYLQCGFIDYSSFYKAFKKETSISPQQYMRSLAEH